MQSTGTALKNEQPRMEFSIDKSNFTNSATEATLAYNTQLSPNCSFNLPEYCSPKIFNEVQWPLKFPEMDPVLDN